jgi:hypothetical protein
MPDGLPPPLPPATAAHAPPGAGSGLYEDEESDSEDDEDDEDVYGRGRGGSGGNGGRGPMGMANARPGEKVRCRAVIEP